MVLIETHGRSSTGNAQQQDAVIDPSQFPEFLGLLEAVDNVEKLISDCAALCSTHAYIRSEITLENFTSMRKVFQTSSTVLDVVSRELNSKLHEFGETIREFGQDISNVAFSYGINLIPDDVLAEIFVRAGETLEDKVAISLVCRRFRGVITSTRELWKDEWLNSNLSAEANLAIAEGNGFRSLVKWSLGNVDCQPFGSDTSTKTILSLIPHIECLSVSDLDTQSLQEVRRALNGSKWPSLRRLQLDYWTNADDDHFYEVCDMPILQSLRAGFVPRSSVAGRLVRCCIVDTIPSDDLRSFLSSATSLQYLLLLLRTSEQGGRSEASCLYETCNVPSLRVSLTNFVPHASLAQRLTAWDFEFNGDTRAGELLAFLSSAAMLQKLYVYIGKHARIVDETSALAVVELPKLVCLGLSCEKVDLDSFTEEAGSIFQVFLTSSPFVREVEIWPIVILEPALFEDIGVDKLLDSPDDPLNMGVLVSALVNASGMELVHFAFWKELHQDYLFSLADAFRKEGRRHVELRFTSCHGWKEGTFGINDVRAACIGH